MAEPQGQPVGFQFCLRLPVPTSVPDSDLLFSPSPWPLSTCLAHLAPGSGMGWRELGRTCVLAASWQLSSPLLWAPLGSPWLRGHVEGSQGASLLSHRLGAPWMAEGGCVCLLGRPSKGSIIGAPGGYVTGIQTHSCHTPKP